MSADTSLPDQRQKSSKHRRPLISWLAATFGISVLIFAGYRLYLATEVWRRLAEIRRTGYPVTPVELDLWYASVPPNENAAVILGKAFAAYQRNESNSPNLPLGGKVKLPPRTEPLPSSMKEAIAEHLELNREALELFHRAAKIGKCRYPIQLQDGFRVETPHLAKIKSAIEFLSLEAMIAVETNALEKAVQTVIDMLSLSRTLKNEPLLISRLVRNAGESITTEAVQRMLNLETLNDDQLSRLFSAFKESEQTAGLRAVLIGERVIGLDAFELAGKDLMELSLTPSTSQDAIHTAKWSVRFMRCLGRYNKERAFYLDGMKSLLSAYDSGFPPGLWKTEELALALDREFQRGRFLHIIAKMHLEAFPKVVPKSARIIAVLRTVQASLAIERFRLARANQLPTALSELTPKFLNSVPSDPFDGQPLRFRKRERGYVVYSIGPDSEDNQGAELSLSRKPEESDGDAAKFDTAFVVER